MTPETLATKQARFRRMASTQVLALRGVLFLGGLLGLATAVGLSSRAIQDVPGAPYTGTAFMTPLEPIHQRLDSRRGDAELGLLQEDRASEIVRLSTQHAIPPTLATVIFDAARSEGVDPGLAFRLVRVESNFNPNARSSADAIGLVQVQLATARHYEPRITEAQLFEPVRNLRIGLRYLRDLNVRYGDDMRLALMAYNVGPTRLSEILEGGRNPTGRYATTVLGGQSFRQKSD